MKQTTDPPDKWILWGFVIVNILIYLWIGLAWHNILTLPEKTPESQLGRENSSVVLVQGNSIKASSPPVMIKPQVLGILTGDMEINEAELLERLWWCEAKHGHEGVWGDNFASFGGFQFQKPTFYDFCEGDWKNFEDQKNCARLMIFELGIGSQHWVRCWRSMGLNNYLN